MPARHGDMNQFEIEMPQGLRASALVAELASIPTVTEKSEDWRIQLTPLGVAAPSMR
jgi:hypothetical protein